MQLDTSKWSGEGAFTQIIIDSLKQHDEVDFLKVEDAPSTRSEADYNFISNELFVRFAVRSRTQHTRRFGFVPSIKSVSEKVWTMAELEQALMAKPDVGPPDYADEGMLQYLRSERIIPPYQTRGYKLVELIRIYEIGSEPRR